MVPPKKTIEESMQDAKDALSEKQESFASSLKKKYGDNSFKNALDDDPLEVVSSGILSVDYVSGVGGIPKGMITTLQGLPSCGKTELALDIALHYMSLDPNNRVYYMDVENRLRKNRLIPRGFDLTRFDFGRSAIAEKVFDIACDLVRSNLYGLIVIDSIAMLVPKADFDQDIEDQTKPGTQGKALAQGYRKLGATMLEVNSKVMVVVINQVMANIGASKYEKKTTPKSGYAPRFLSSFTMDLEQLLGKDRVTVDSNGNRLSNEIKISVEKNSLSKFQNRKAYFELNYDTGPVLASELFNLGMGYGLITKEGMKNYKVKSEKEVISVCGYDNLIHRFNTDLDLAGELKEKIQKNIREGILMTDTDPDVEG